MLFVQDAAFLMPEKPENLKDLLKALINVFLCGRSGQDADGACDEPLLGLPPHLGTPAGQHLVTPQVRCIMVQVCQEHIFPALCCCKHCIKFLLSELHCRWKMQGSCCISRAILLLE